MLENKYGMNSDLVFSILEAAAMQKKTNDSRNIFIHLPRFYYLVDWTWLGWWGVAKQTEFRSGALSRLYRPLMKPLQNKPVWGSNGKYGY